MFSIFIGVCVLWAHPTSLSSGKHRYNKVWMALHLMAFIHDLKKIKFALYSSIFFVHFAMPPYASLPRPPVGTVLYDRVYNDDLMSIKVQLMNMLAMNRLPNMPMGFPFRFLNDGRGGSYLSRESYEFQEHFCLSDHRARRQSVTFSYTAPSMEREQLSWQITVPSRESSNWNTPGTSLLRIPACKVE